MITDRLVRRSLVAQMKTLELIPNPDLFSLACLALRLNRAGLPELDLLDLEGIVHVACYDVSTTFEKCSNRKCHVMRMAESKERENYTK